jgi:hypothetical protein
MGIFLSPEATAPSDERYVALGYDTICQLVESMAARASGEAELLMNHYAQMVRRNVLEDTRIAELCRGIYSRHRDALDKLFEYRFDRQQQVWTFLSQLIKETPVVEEDHSTKSYIRFYLPAWDSSPALREGDGWTKTRRLLLYQFNNTPKQLVLTLVIGPGPDETRRRLLDTVLSRNDVFNPSWKQLGKSWNTVYQREILGAAALTDSEFDLAAEAIRNAWNDFISNTLPDQMAVFASEDWLWSGSTSAV